MKLVTMLIVGKHEDKPLAEGQMGPDDALFHEELLGPDTLPKKILDKLRQQAERLGLPNLVPR